MAALRGKLVRFLNSKGNEKYLHRVRLSAIPGTMDESGNPHIAVKLNFLDIEAGLFRITHGVDGADAIRVLEVVKSALSRVLPARYNLQVVPDPERRKYLTEGARKFFHDHVVLRIIDTQALGAKARPANSGALARQPSPALSAFTAAPTALPDQMQSSVPLVSLAAPSGKPADAPVLSSAPQVAPLVPAQALQQNDSAALALALRKKFKPSEPVRPADLERFIGYLLGGKSESGVRGLILPAHLGYPAQSARLQEIFSAVQADVKDKFPGVALSLKKTGTPQIVIED